MSHFLMPSLGADMADGTLVEHSIAAGETFQRGDIIGAVETQKGVIEIEVFEDGILDHWLVDIGRKVPVGTPLAVLRKDGEPVRPDPAPPEFPPKPTPEPVPVSPEASQVPEQPPEQLPREIEPPEEPSPPPSSSAHSRPRVTPAARRFAAKRGIDLGSLAVSPGTTIGLGDVEAMSTSKVPAAVSDMRSAIAAAMSRSKREIPHYYLSHQLDVTVADALVAKQNAIRPPESRLLLGALFAKAIAKALAKYPEFNGHFQEDLFHPAEPVHLGIAISIRSGGLVAPALFEANEKSVDELMLALRDLTTRVRAGRFRARELSDATITLTSLGARGVDSLFGVIYPPQVAIVGIGTPRLQPMVHDGEVTARLAATLSLAADHRVSDGHRGALFLKSIDTHLQRPELL